MLRQVRRFLERALGLLHDLHCGSAGQGLDDGQVLGLQQRDLPAGAVPAGECCLEGAQDGPLQPSTTALGQRRFAVEEVRLVTAPMNAIQ